MVVMVPSSSPEYGGSTLVSVGSLVTTVVSKFGNSEFMACTADVQIKSLEFRLFGNEVAKPFVFSSHRLFCPIYHP